MITSNGGNAINALWTSAEAAAATGGRAVGRWIAGGLAIDSRELAPGDLFIALKDRRDGHAFVPAAYEAGAAAAMVERRAGEGPVLVVPNTLKALEDLAAAARERSPARRVAVTGSVGKTTLKELLAVMFAAAGSAHASVKSFNNHWGAPLSLARMPRHTERAVFELGMNHAGEIRPLAQLIQPEIAVITKIAPAHLENLGSLEAIADAKAEIFEGLTPWGAAVIPSDDNHGERLAERAGAAGAGWLVRFGADAQAEAHIADFSWTADSAEGTVVVFGKPVRFFVPVGGPHWGQTMAAALAAAYLADAPLDAAADAVREFGALAGRGAALTLPVPGGELTVIDEAYNANPASMTAAIASLGARTPGPSGRRIACIGEMLELGGVSAELHAALWRDLDAAGVDIVHVVGDGARALYDAVPENRRGSCAPTVADVADAVAREAGAGDIILVKGSNSVGMGAVIDALKTRADQPA